MSSILFGLILISAAIQTAVAIIAEGDLIAVPLIVATVLVGLHSVKIGVARTNYKVSVRPIAR